MSAGRTEYNPRLITSPPTRRRARTPSPSSGRLRFGMNFFAVLGTLFLFLYVGEYAMIARFNHQRTDLRRELYRMNQENTNLKAQVISLERPSRIVNLARSMGMIERNEADFVSLAPQPQMPVAPRQPRTLASFLPEGWFNHSATKQ